MSQSKIKKVTLLCAAALSIAVLVLFAKDISQGIKNGISISLNIAIPSLLMFMILSNIIAGSELVHIISRPFKFAAERLFKIPCSAMSIVLLSLIGGYPIGAKMIASSVANKQITPMLGERLLCFCVNCGPAFLINAVGILIFGNAKIGLIIYLSQIISCVIIGIISSVNAPTFQNSTPTAQAKKSTSVLIVSSVTDAVKTMSMLCGFIVVFSAFLPLIEQLFSAVNPSISTAVRGLLEVTSFCGSLVGASSPAAVMLAAIFTAFGGICVHLQISAILSGSGVRMKKFLGYRILYTFISAVVVRTALFIAPDALACISASIDEGTSIFSVSPAATCFLVLLSIMLLFFSRKSVKMI